jgi:aprataxin
MMNKTREDGETESRSKHLKLSSPSKVYKPTHPQANIRATTGPIRGNQDNLLLYVQSPSEHSSVIYYDEHWVLLRDKYPKAVVHLLLMPRDPEYYTQHPFRAFANKEFLVSAKLEVLKAKRVAASELRRLLGKYSERERPRIEGMDSDNPPDELPKGRDWETEIKAGVHAHPSMHHMHIHIISKDNYSDALKRRQHYNTFNTPFFVRLDEFPLPEDDVRWTLQVEPYYHDWNYKCWRCNRNFGNKFTELKRHLEKEYLEWRQE